jgi:ribose transport system substrate-binding protein
VEQQAALEQVKAAGIPIVSWHAGPVIGPDPATGRKREFPCTFGSV